MRLWIIASTLLLTACGLQTIPESQVNRLPEWQPQIHHPTFGQWQVINCELIAQTYDFTIRSNGKLENNQLWLRFSSRQNLPIPPRLSLNTLPTMPLYAKGANYYFNTALPFHPTVLHAMGQPDAYLFMTYQTAANTPSQQAFFNTNDLLNAWRTRQRMPQCQ